MRKEKWKGRQLGGWLERMQRTFTRLCGGQIRRSGASALSLPGLPVTAELPIQAMAVRRFAPPKQRGQSVLPAIAVPAGQPHIFSKRERNAIRMRKGAVDGVRGLAGVHSNAVNSGETYGVRGLAGVHSNAANSGATYGVRGLAGVHSNAANSGVTYGVRGLAGVHSNAANSGATYGVVQGLAGVHSSAVNSGATTVQRLSSPRMMHQPPLLRMRTPDAHATNGLRGLAGAIPAPVGGFAAVAAQSRPMTAQPKLWRAPSALPLRIPSPLSGDGSVADAAAQVQVYVTNNCKIETPVDYQTVWDKLEDALRESLSVVAAGG